jgi:hypothetical protein
VQEDFLVGRSIGPSAKEQINQISTDYPVRLYLQTDFDVHQCTSKTVRRLTTRSSWTLPMAFDMVDQEMQVYGLNDQTTRFFENVSVQGRGDATGTSAS